MDTLEQPGNRLQAYKRLKTEPDDIKAARKLLEGVKLRREERDKQFAKKRELGSSDDESAPDRDNEQPMSQGETLQDRQAQGDKMEEEPSKGREEDSLYSLEEMKEQAKLLYSKNEEDLLGPVTYFRKCLIRQCLLPHQPDIPVDFSSVVELGILPRIMELLSTVKSDELKFETAWVVTNIAGGASEYTKQIVDGGGVPALMQMLSMEDCRLSDQALWALGNIIGDGAELRDYVLDHGIVPAIMKFSDHLLQLPLRLFDTISWVICTLCRHKPYCDIDEIGPMFGMLKDILTSKRSEPSLVDACQALFFLSDGGVIRIQVVLVSELCPLLLNLLGWSENVSWPILRVFANITSGIEMQTQAVIDLGVLGRLEPFTHSPNDSVQDQAFWMISNILAGTQAQIQSVIDCGLIQPVVKYLSEGSWIVQKQCVWCICNLLFGGSQDQRSYAVSLGCLPLLCAHIGSEDEELVHCVLQSFEVMLTTGSAEPVVKAMVETGGLENFKHLEEHPNQNIKLFYLKVINLCHKFEEAM